MARRVLSRFLPPDPRAAEPYRLTPRLALRIAVLGMLAIAVFAVLFLRLWALQVLSGAQYLRAAQNNQLRTVRIQAQRGPILDREGRMLVTNTATTAVQVWPSDLPKQRSVRVHELRALARVVNVPLWQIAAAIRKHGNDALTPVNIKYGATESQVGYLTERQEDFPGVHTAQTYLRLYPHGALAAHLLGGKGRTMQPHNARERIEGDIHGQALVFDEPSAHPLRPCHEFDVRRDDARG